MRYWLVMPAAGTGRRFGAEAPKQYAPLEGRTVIEWALAPFLADARCARIVVALAPGDEHWGRLPLRERVLTATGGTERSDSVRNALAALSGAAQPLDWVLVHDAARPCLESADLERLLRHLGAHPVGGLLGVRVADTLKRGEGAGVEATVLATEERAGLWRALTPQMFRYGALCAALDAARAAGRTPSDEAQALEWHGERPLLIEGAASNLKVTTTADLCWPVPSCARATYEEAPMRVGCGFDVHAFGPGNALMLGGVRVAHTHGVIAHSDGDVLLHALCDALARGGRTRRHRSALQGHRPAVARRRQRALRHRGARAAARPRAHGRATRTSRSSRRRPSSRRIATPMRQRIAQLLGIEVARVNLKATTTEGLGFLGRAEGIAAQAVVLLREDSAGGG